MSVISQYLVTYAQIQRFLFTAIKPKSKHGFRAGAILLLCHAIEEKEVPAQNQHNFVNFLASLCVCCVVIIDCKDVERTRSWDGFLLS